MFSFAGRQKNPYLTALVPGQLGVAVAEVTPGDEKPRLASCDFKFWEGDAPQDNVLAAKVKEYGLSKKQCTTVMELGDCSIFIVDSPDVPQHELRAALRWQIKDMIDFHIDDAVIDVFDAPPAASGRQNSMYVVVTKNSTVQQRVDQLEAAEARLETIDIPELALRNITARLPEDEHGAAFLYLTEDHGVLIITRQKSLYLARTLDIGYRFLRQGQEQEDESGLSIDNSGNLDRLVLEIQRSLDYYDRYFMQPAVAGLVMAPTELPIPGLEDYLNQSLGIPVRTLDLNDIIASDEPLSLQRQAHCLVAIGAALREEVKTL